ncbi:DUF5378 family protein [Mycoplasma corogypsi]|uniref:DUF5378 family protein n=1 Tax=Mycoplasma corogypsi TaxID=2106 RepID=UPI0038736CF0
MTISDITLILIAFAFISIVFVQVINRKFYKFLDNYYIRMGIGLFVLAYVIAFRFSGDWAKIIEYIQLGHKAPQNWAGRIDFDNLTNMQRSLASDFINNRDLVYYNYTLSRVLLIELCPFFTVALCLTMIFGKKKFASFIVSPFCIFASLLVIPFVATTDQTNALESFKSFRGAIKFIFFGSDLFRLYYFIHWFILVFGSLAFVNYDPKLNHKTKSEIIVKIHITAFIFIMYVTTMKYSFNIIEGTTGLSYYDWITGSFRAVGTLVNKFTSYVHPIDAIIFYAIAYFSIIGIALLRFASFGLIKTKILPKFKLKFQRT